MLTLIEATSRLTSPNSYERMKAAVIDRYMLIRTMGPAEVNEGFFLDFEKIKHKSIQIMSTKMQLNHLNEAITEMDIAGNEDNLDDVRDTITKNFNSLMLLTPGNLIIYGF